MATALVPIANGSEEIESVCIIDTLVRALAIFNILLSSRALSLSSPRTHPFFNDHISSAALSIL